MPAGLPILKQQLLKETTKHQANPKLYNAVLELANIDSAQLDFYQKAYLGLALSKTRTLLESPTPENYQAYVKLANSMAKVNSGFAIILSSILLCIAGAAAIALGIVATMSTGGAAAPLIGVGILLSGYGIYKLERQFKQQSPVLNPVIKILEEHTPIEADTPELSCCL